MPAVVAVVAADVTTSFPLEPVNSEVAVPSVNSYATRVSGCIYCLKVTIRSNVYSASSSCMVAVVVAAKSAAVNVAVNPVVALIVSEVTVPPPAESNVMVSTLLAAPVELMVADVTPADEVAVILAVPLFTVPPEILIVCASVAVAYA